jgi:DNA-binding transcriptional regulator YiaG
VALQRFHKRRFNQGSALRRRTGLSTERFGRLFSVFPRTAEQWEQGRRQPRSLTFRELEKGMAKKREQMLLF